MELYEHQKRALKELKNGSILCGDVGSGKSLTALSYYHVTCGGQLNPYRPRREKRPLYIITTAKKRDDKEWLLECLRIQISEDEVTIDSWNNIKKYKNVYGAFFIFDEQRVTGHGVWVKTFLNITRKNKWILLSATPGDKWEDYIPVFVANGFYRNMTEFRQEHLRMASYTNFPKVIGYLNVRKLECLRDSILVPMDFQKKTVPHHITVWCDYDKVDYKKVWIDRWDIYKDQPIDNPPQLFSLIRKVVNSNRSRLTATSKVLMDKKRVIIFYSFDYELELLEDLCKELDVPYAQWNGHKHEEIPEGDVWAYLVNYGSGSEGWNCILTDTILFYSLDYSYRRTVQAAGRIDRLNTKYVDLYYYHLRSKAPIDIAIWRCIQRKEEFNERKFLGRQHKDP